MRLLHLHILYCIGLHLVLAHTSLAQTQDAPIEAAPIELKDTSGDSSPAQSTAKDRLSPSSNTMEDPLELETVRSIKKSNENWMVHDLVAIGVGLYNAPQEEDLEMEDTPYNLAYDADLTYFQTRQLENVGIQTGANVSSASVKKITKATLYTSSVYLSLRYGYWLSDSLRIYGMTGPAFFNSVLKFRYGSDRNNTGLGWSGGAGMVWGSDQLYFGLQALSFARTGNFGKTTIAGTTKIADGSNQVHLVIYYWR